ncbi:type I secretion system permease/ATPase [Elioraea sp.]|uniref:type I secretion system permease/ATPase n=1 Tax=Elioraea sp. TaxID=2185103 RepID=UPI003F6F2D5B
MTAPLIEARAEIVFGLLVSVALTLGVTVGVMVVPLYDMHLFDRVLTSRSLHTLVALSVICLAGMVIYAVLSAIRGVILAGVAERVLRRLHGPVIEAGMRHAVDGDGKRVARALSDLQEIRLFFSGGAAAAPLDLMLSPVLIAVLFLMHPALGWFALAAATALLGWAVMTDALARPRMAAAQARMEAALTDTGTLLRDPVLVEGLGMAPAIERRWRGGQARGLAALAEAIRRGEGVGAAARLTRMLMQGGMIALAALLAVRGEATPGVLVGANLMLALLLMPLDQVMTHWRAVAATQLAWQRLTALLAVTPPTPETATEPRFAGIALRGVVFHPPGSDRPVLAGVTLEVAPGEVVALLGPNAAGKSSLARIAAGVLAPTGGVAEAAGLVAAAAASSGMIGYLPQRPQLLDASISDTIARFRPASAEHVVGAARAAGMHETIGRLPQGYGTPIGPLDPLLSGGQKQRLALARALFGECPVLVLDEPDAGLDHEGEAAMAAAIVSARKRGAAVLVITHRRALLAVADRIVRIVDGRLAEAPPTEAP